MAELAELKNSMATATAQSVQSLTNMHNMLGDLDEEIIDAASSYAIRDAQAGLRQTIEALRRLNRIAQEI
jgi:hypothetical protein